jgi:hypothetical protein
MPAPLIYQSRQKQHTDAHAELYYKMNIGQQACYLALEQYNPTGAGTMNSTAYRIPNTNNFVQYTSGGGEIQFNGNNYSSLTPADKKIVFKYLDALTEECLRQYDITYNL